MEKFSAIVESIYAATLDAQLWPSVLSSMSLS